MEEYGGRVLAAEALPESGRATCGHDALWRCRSCYGRPTFCTKCCRDTHSSHPLHRIEFWEGSFYRAAWLRQVGVQIHCGHGGSPCPSLIRNMASSEDWEDTEDISVQVSDLPWIGSDARGPPDTTGAVYSNDRSVVVIDTGGIHELSFTFCDCLGAVLASRQDLQLLDLGFYPATRQRPRTVFTFRVLDDFLLTQKECNASARNYYNKLRRITNSALPHMVPDRYRELLRVSRQWRVQKMHKRAGFAHHNNSPGPGDLALRCPACPHPGINIPDNWKDDPEQWKYSRAVVLDGNFSARHRPMKNPEEDVRLADGLAFTVGQVGFRTHLNTGKEFREDPTCQEHRATLAATSNHGKYDATGIGAAACSRHGFFQPHACVDFQQGERQINMDYIVNWILAFLNGLQTLLLLYDIMCQYFTHFHRRFKESSSLSIPSGTTFLRGIGQFHVHGHLPRCFPRFSLNFIKGAGVQDGEVIETLWSKLNGIANSARGMGAAHRHELIDDCMNDSNWAKLVKIVPATTMKWRRVFKQLPLAASSHAALSAAADPTDIAQWTADAAAADEARGHDVEAMDIYDVHKKPLPTQKEIHMDLVEEELREEDLGSSGEATWLSAGLRLEKRKLSIAHAAQRLRTDASESERLDLRKQRERLARAIVTFHNTAKTHLSLQSLPDSLLPAEDLVGSGGEWDDVSDPSAAQPSEDGFLRPEEQAIALPSTLGIQYLVHRGRADLALKERKLREGQMNDSLQAIRTGIGYKSLLYRTKIRKANSTKSKLRSFDEVHVADETVRRHVRIYSQSRRAMERLFIPGDPAEDAEKARILSRYKPIVKKDLHASTTALEAFTPGLRMKSEAWFWALEDSSNGAGGTWLKGFRRMLWLRSFARAERWKEEKVWVLFEMDCIIRFFQHRAAEWSGFKAAAPSPGHTAYAARQEHMWSSLQLHAETKFAQARTDYRVIEPLQNAMQ
ncbi:hypothetical protein C8Q80DRAFT_1262908 [Daedaleopsis nitida]|nr:hypothetical protein C8Q80DRAFT_1262908 [Daedaleopsis nitida]